MSWFKKKKYYAITDNLLGDHNRRDGEITVNKAPAFACAKHQKYQKLRKLYDLRKELKEQLRFYTQYEIYQPGIGNFKNRAKDVSDKIILADEEIEKLLGEDDGLV
jgi:hypothetical protein